jgi:hypothetical protein
MLPSKLFFLISYGITVFIILFYFGNLLSLVFELPYSKVSEIVIIAIGIIIVFIFLYFAHKQGFKIENYRKGIILFGVSWLISVLTIIIGLLFFNGPLHWQ